LGGRKFLARTAAGLTVAAVLTPNLAHAASRPAPRFASSHWGIIYRNVTGGPNAVLRAGPYSRNTIGSGPALVPPPYGVGSLGIIVGTGAEKVSFGNETDFFGLPLRDLNVMKYWVYAGADSLVGVSLPLISIEVNPHLGTSTFTSLNYVPESSVPPSAPPARVPNTWQQYAATAAGSSWYATGSVGTAIGCTIVTTCSYDVLRSRLPNAAVSFSLAITKGHDNPFAGAVDGLQINHTVFDFERTGVFRRAPKP
jgi:hypothetical protein